MEDRENERPDATKGNVGEVVTDGGENVAGHGAADKKNGFRRDFFDNLKNGTASLDFLVF